MLFRWMARDDDDDDDFGCAACRAADYCGNGAAEATCQQCDRIQPAVKERFTRPDTPSQTPIAPSYEARIFLRACLDCAWFSEGSTRSTQTQSVVTSFLAGLLFSTDSYVDHRLRSQRLS